MWCKSFVHNAINEIIVTISVNKYIALKCISFFNGVNYDKDVKPFIPGFFFDSFIFSL